GYPICITDWGDARAHDAAPGPYAPSPASWHYTSPELAVGDPIDDRTDGFGPRRSRVARRLPRDAGRAAAADRSRQSLALDAIARVRTCRPERVAVPRSRGNAVTRRKVARRAARSHRAYRRRGRCRTR